VTDFLRTFTILIVHTPLWVWALYGLLVFLGLQRTRDGSISLVRVLILPLVVGGLAIASVIGAGLDALPIMLVSFALGGAIGWQFEREGATARLANGKIWLRGEWLTFGQILAVLVFRYAINAIPFVAPALNADTTWHTSSLFVSAALSALFLGRTAARLKVYFTPQPAIA
jgi:hypothetical protein